MDSGSEKDKLLRNQSNNDLSEESYDCVDKPEDHQEQSCCNDLSEESYVCDDIPEDHQEQSCWKMCCSEFWNTVCILPLFGEVDFRNRSCPDVKYGALVLFMTVIAICLGFLMAAVLTKPKDYKDMFALTIVFLLAIGVLLQIIMCSFTQERITYAHESRNESSLMLVKLFFLAVLSIGSIVYSGFNIYFQFDCDHFTSFNDIFYVLGSCVGIIFTISQFVFLLCRCKIRPCQDIGIYYFAPALFIVINFLNYAKHSIDFHFEDLSDEIDVHDCKNGSSNFTAKYKEHIRPIIDPMVFEVSILAILLYWEVISRQLRILQNQSNDSAAGQDLNGAFENINLRYVVGVIILSILICTPMFVFKLLQVNAKDGYKVEISITYACAKLILYGVLILCFHLLRNKERHNDGIPLSLFDLLLLISALGSIIFFTLHLISTFYSKDYMFTAKNILNIVTTYLQTVLILKLRKYKQIEYDHKLLNCLLFCAMVNLLLWIFDTFIEAQFVYKQLHTMSVFGVETFLNIRHVLLPLIIYYRFKCFLGFLKCSNVLSFVRCSANR